MWAGTEFEGGVGVVGAEAGAFVVMIEYVAIRLTRLPDLPLSLCANMHFFFSPVATAMNQARNVSLHSTLAKPSLTEDAPKAPMHTLNGAGWVGVWGWGGGCVCVCKGGGGVAGAELT